MHISEWIEKGQPKNEWFAIMRQEDLRNLDENTPNLLSNLIKLALQRYGNFETRQYEPALISDYYLFENDGHKFIIFESTGVINSEICRVMTMCIEARIVD